MGSYSVRPPYQAFGQSVGRQIAEKKDRGFSANMRRLTEALEPYALQGRRQRFSERMQEDAQAHDIAMKEKEVDNWKAQQEERFSYAQRLSTWEREQEQEQAAQRGEAWTALSAAIEADPSIKSDFGRMQAEMGKHGETVEPGEISSMLALSGEERAGKRFENEQEKFAHQRKLFAFELEQTRAQMEQARLTTAGMMAYTPADKALAAKQLDELGVFDALGKSELQYRKMLADVKTAEQASQVKEIVLSTAKKSADLLYETNVLNNSIARTNNELKKTEAERGDMDWYFTLADRAATRATTSVEHYDELANDVLAKLQGIDKDKEPAIYATQLKTLKQFVESKNSASKKYLGTQYYVNDEGDTVTVEVDAKKTAAVAKTREIIQSLTPMAATPEKNAEALLSALDLDAVDTQFLYAVPETLQMMGHDMEYINRVMKYYKDNSERIISARRVKEAAEKDAAEKAMPTTTGDMGSEDEMNERKKSIRTHGFLPWLGDRIKQGGGGA